MRTNKHRVPALLLLSVFGLAPNVYAQQGAGAANCAKPISAAEVAGFVGLWIKQLNTNQASNLSWLYAENARLVHPGDVRFSREKISRYWEKQFSGTHINAGLRSGSSVKSFSTCDSAVAQGIITSHQVNRTNPTTSVTVDYLFTVSYVRQPDQEWKIVEQHAIPIGIPPGHRVGMIEISAPNETDETSR